jgi:type III secretion protein U
VAVSARTEQATPRRLREARRRGEVAVSRELCGAAALMSGLAVLAATGPALAAELARLVRGALAEAVSPAAPTQAAALLHASAALARAALPPCAAAGLGGLAAGLFQTGGLFTLEAIRPRLERLDPARGLGRLFSGARLASLALGLSKASFALAAAAWLGRAALWPALGSSRLAAAPLLRVGAAIALRLALGLGALLALLGLVELLAARRRQRRALMMTRAEVQRERRDDEGDPRLVAERRRLGRALAAAPLRRAACLVVNPTHVAVALQHAPASDEAPVVLAKGLGQAAAALRREARRLGVPVVRDVALARALFRLADVGEEIPEELYHAAAAVLLHVHRLQGALA